MSIPSKFDGEGHKPVATVQVTQMTATLTDGNPASQTSRGRTKIKMGKLDLGGTSSTGGIMAIGTTFTVHDTLTLGKCKADGDERPEVSQALVSTDDVAAPSQQTERDVEIECGDVVGKMTAIDAFVSYGAEVSVKDVNIRRGEL